MWSGGALARSAGIRFNQRMQWRDVPEAIDMPSVSADESIVPTKTAIKMRTPASHIVCPTAAGALDRAPSDPNRSWVACRTKQSSEPLRRARRARGATRTCRYASAVAAIVIMNDMRKKYAPLARTYTAAVARAHPR